MVYSQLLKQQHKLLSHESKALFDRKKCLTKLKTTKINKKFSKKIIQFQRTSSCSRSSLFFAISDLSLLTVLGKHTSLDIMKAFHDLSPYLSYYLSAFYRLIIMFIYRMLTLSYCIILTRNYWLYLVEVRETQSSSWKKKKKSNPLLVPVDNLIYFFRGWIPPIFGVLDPSLIITIMVWFLLMQLVDIRPCGEW